MAASLVRVGITQIERRGRAMQHQARRLDRGRIVGDAEAKRLEIRQPRAELLSFLHVGDGAVETELRAPERAGRDVETAAVERAHGNP
jgi:hypothetical protein